MKYNKRHGLKNKYSTANTESGADSRAGICVTPISQQYITVDTSCNKKKSLPNNNRSTVEYHQTNNMYFCEENHRTRVANVVYNLGHQLVYMASVAIPN